MRGLLGKCCGVWLAVVWGVAQAGDWPLWRGPWGIGVGDDVPPPLTWSPTQNIRWKVPLPEEGNSSPIVVGDKVWLTCPAENGQQRLLLCFDRREGRELWRRAVTYSAPEKMHQTNPHCSPSPASDGERVVVWHGSAGLLCYDLSGRELWRKDLGAFDHIWGYGSSPIIDGDYVFLNAGPGTRSFVVAFHKHTGEELWRRTYPGMAAETPQEYRGSWSTPVLAGQGPERLLLLSLPNTLWAVDPRTGEEVWRCAGLGDLVYTSPLVTGDIVVAMSGYHGPALACRLGGRGDVTETHRLWRHERPNPQRIGSGVAVDGYVYILNENGTLWCLNAETGEKTWEQRLGGTSWGSMCYVAGRLYVQNMRGTVFVLAANPRQMELLAENKLGEGSRSSPAFSQGEVFVRTFAALYAIAAE